MTPAEQKRAAKYFVARWESLPCVEEEHSRSFWIELLQDVLGVQNATHALEFERKVKGRKIDVFYEDMGILVEMKGRGISLDEATVRSKKAGPETPYQQAKWYADNLPNSIRPRWIITCNFDEFRIYDMEAADDQYVSLALEELPEQVHLLSFFSDRRNSRLVKEKELSVKAGELVGKLYAQLSQQYRNIETDAHEQRSLNVLIVRLVFLLYAEDSGLLHEKDALLNYLKRFPADQMRQAVIDLFAVLDTPADARDPYLPEYLLAFPYVNGGLFGDDDIVVPQFTDQIRLDLLLEASQSFDWSHISPTIFGAAFESTLNPATRRAGGMHYTSIENIHKVIDPLFLEDLRAELSAIESNGVERNRKVRLRAFQRKLASINVFDPACGSGNFLTESYLSLRKLENRVLEDLQGDQMSIGFDGESSPIQVSINQFFGIEINDFAVSVAKTALWIAEEQMMEATQEILLQPFDFLPLKSNDNIHEGNALRMDWKEVLPAEKCSYIIGNPPFLGARNQTKEQKAELIDVFGGAKNSGNVDYVAGWYMKAAEYMDDHPVRCAFVSTNSICQGEQVANVWRPLWDLGIRIDFAHDTFRWVNEANGQAHVFVIIVGFSKLGGGKRLFHHAGPDAPAMELRPSNVNAYLSDAPMRSCKTSASRCAAFRRSASATNPSMAETTCSNQTSSKRFWRKSRVRPSSCTRGLAPTSSSRGRSASRYGSGMLSLRSSMFCRCAASASRLFVNFALIRRARPRASWPNGRQTTTWRTCRRALPYWCRRFLPNVGVMFHLDSWSRRPCAATWCSSSPTPRCTILACCIPNSITPGCARCAVA